MVHEGCWVNFRTGLEIWKYRHPVKETRRTVTNDRQLGRPRSLRVSENTENAEDLVLSQEDNPKTHRSIREISRKTGIRRSTVHRIIHRDLQLKCVKRRRAQELSETNRVARLTRCKQLLNRYSDPAVDFIIMVYGWKSVYRPTTIQLAERPRVYAPVGTKKRHIDPSARRHVFNIQQVGYGVRCRVKSGYHWTDIYRLGWRWTTSITRCLAVSADASSTTRLSFNNRPAALRHMDTIQLLQRETPDIIGLDLWPPNSPDLNPADYKIWGVVQQRVYVA